MSAFGNADFNRIYLHSALRFFADTAASGFIFAFLLKTGLPLPYVFLVITATAALRFLLRQLVLPLVLRVGLRPVMVTGLAFSAASYAVLPMVSGIGLWLVIWIILDALGSSLFWSCYHTFITQLGDADKRGAQISMKEAINTVSGIIAPAIAAALLTFVSAFAAFLFFASIMVLSIIPLIAVTNVSVQKTVTMGKSKVSAGRNFFMSDGMIAGADRMWQTGIFITLGSSYMVYGGVLAFASLVGAGASVFIGRLMDREHARPTLFWVYAATSSLLLFNAFAYSNVSTVIVASILGAIIGPIFYPVMMTPIYNLSKSSECPLRFHIKTEGGWDIGYGATGLIAAAATATGMSLTWPLLIGFAGSLLGYTILSGLIRSS
jgi:MFS transporter, DHA1 family, inner membrane transport protein